jgi:hypothetical protein
MLSRYSLLCARAAPVKNAKKTVVRRALVNEFIFNAPHGIETP